MNEQVSKQIHTIGPARRHLVLLRAGDQSLHPTWYGKGERSWDLALSYFGDQVDPYPQHHDFLHRFKGSKWQGIADFVRRYPDLLARYERIWLPDDDLLATQSAINLLFDASGAYGLSLTQPALRFYSHVSWGVTLQHPWAHARETNFVEVMAPCFDRAAWQAMSDTFSENSSGWGLEWLWLARARAQGLRLGVIDEAAVFHTRPVGSAGHGGGLGSPIQEMKDLLQRHGLRRETPRTLRYLNGAWTGALCPSFVLLQLNRMMIRALVRP